jgi:integrase
MPGSGNAIITSSGADGGRPFWGEHRMIFPSSAGTCRDPDNFDKQWRKVRGDLGVPDVTSHSFRKSLATMIDDAGLSARVGADQLGHAKASMTQDRYMRRGKVHAEVAALLDRSITGE